jgi:hypothetical protein
VQSNSDCPLINEFKVDMKPRRVAASNETPRTQNRVPVRVVCYCHVLVMGERVTQHE